MKRWLWAMVALTGLLQACTDPGNPNGPLPLPVASVVVSPATTSLDPGETLQLTATAFDESGAALAGRALTWTTGNPNVATVSATGLVTASSGGSVQISATSEGKSGMANLTVRPLPPPVAWIDVIPSGEVMLTEGATQQLEATLYASDGEVLTGRTVTWESGDPEVAAVTESGLVGALSVGTTWIAAVSEGLRDEMLIRVVSSYVPVSWVEIEPSSVTIALGGTQQLAAIAHAADDTILGGRTPTWASQNPSLATVSPDGLVEGISPGGTIITATIDGQIAELPVNVAAVDHVTLTPEASTIYVSATLQLLAQPCDVDGTPLDRPVTWSIDRPAVATVDSNGLVLARGAGHAVITATTDGKSATARVWVTGSAEYSLSSVHGSALPATIFTYAEPLPQGGTRNVRVEVDGGVLRIDIVGGRYEQLWWGTDYPDGSDPISTAYEMTGAVAWDDLTRTYTFTSDDDAMLPSTGSYLPDGSLRMVWQAQEWWAETAFVFIRQ